MQRHTDGGVNKNHVFRKICGSHLCHCMYIGASQSSMFVFHKFVYKVGVCMMERQSNGLGMASFDFR
jgi:hypothetical protein